MDIKQILRLHSEGNSQREISKLLRIHRKTINFYISRIGDLGVDISTLLTYSESEVDALFKQSVISIKNAKHEELMQFFSSHEKDFKCVGFTVNNLWEVYQQDVLLGFCRSQFFGYYRQRYKTPKGSLKINHIHGDKLFLDYAGKHLYLTDKESGERRAMEIFVGILPSSQYIFVEASYSQRTDDFILATTNCLEFMGGVPRSITTDNLKASVIQASKTEPKLNKTFKDFAYHYKTVITPTRAYSPKDKAMVEGAVRIVYCSIFYALRHQCFYDLESLNRAIRIELSKLNMRLLSNRSVSRYDEFIQEKAHLNPLPQSVFEVWHYKYATVQKMGYIFCSSHKNYYSIPYRFIGRQIQVRINTRILEAYCNGELLATHLLSNKQGSYTTVAKHLHSDNQFYQSWSPEFFEKQAGKIGVHTKEYVVQMIAQSKYPETAYKSSLGIIALQRIYPIERIEKACLMGLDYPYHNCGIIKTILENKCDLQYQESAFYSPLEDIANIIHDNIRGSNYYQ